MEKEEDLSQYVKFERKDYPLNIPHWNPEHKDYVPDEWEEHLMLRSVDSYNQIVDNFKRDLKLQQQIMDYMTQI